MTFTARSARSSDVVDRARARGWASSTRAVQSMGFASGLAAAVIAAAILARVVMLTRESYWTDELWSLDASGMDFKTMFGARLQGEQNPPLYYLTLWVWNRLTGSVAEIPVRSLSLTFGVVTISALWRFGSRIGHRSVGVIAAVLMAVSGVGIHFSLEARGYGMATMFVALSLAPWVSLAAQRDRVAHHAFLFALFGSLAGFAHYYGNLVYGLQIVLLLGYLLAARRVRDALRVVSWCTASLVPLLVWLIFTRSRLTSGGLAPSTVQTLWDASSAMVEPFPTALDRLGTLVTVPSWILERRTQTGALGLTILIVAAVALAVQSRLALRGDRSRSWRLPVLGLVCLFLTAVAVTIAYQSSQSWKPTLSVRNLIVLLPLIFVAMGCAITGLNRRRPGIGIVAVALTAAGVLVLAVPAWAQAGTRGTGPPSPQFEPAARYLLDQGAASGGRNLVGLQPPYDWTGDWLAASSAVSGRGPTLTFPSAMAGAHWTTDPVALPDRSTLPPGPIVAFGFDNWDPARLKAFTDLAATAYGPCVSVPFDHIGVVRCQG